MNLVTAHIKQITACKNLKVFSVELHTGEFCDNKKNRRYEYKKLKKSAIFATKNNLECHAGHGLSYVTVEKIAKINEITELNIGHFVIGEAVFTGLKESILIIWSLNLSISIILPVIGHLVVPAEGAYAGL